MRGKGDLKLLQGHQRDKIKTLKKSTYPLFKVCNVVFTVISHKNVGNYKLFYIIYFQLFLNRKDDYLGFLAELARETFQC